MDISRPVRKWSMLIDREHCDCRFYGLHAGERNDLRQLAVNARALGVGAGVGTALRDGVPGAEYYYGFSPFPYHNQYDLHR